MVGGHDVGAVQKIGDAAETLCLALREESALAYIQPHELRVFVGRAGGENFQLERLRPFRQVFQHQLAILHLERGALPIDQHARQVQLFAVQPQGLGGRVRVATQRHFVEHACFGRIQIKGQIHRINPERGRCVIRAFGDGGCSNGVAQGGHSGFLGKGV